MGITLPNRFQPIHFFRRDRSSATFLATDHRLGRNEVVVKILGRTAARRDAEAIHALSWYQGLRHSLISEVLDAGVSRTGDLYYVRPHLAGSEFFSAPSMNRVKSLLSAVDFLYSKGRTHGSLKPANIFTVGEEVRLADPWLGLTSPSETKSMTEEDVRFTAPEVLAGGPLTSESDLYSLGAVLYRFYSGRDPFEDSDLEFLQAKYIWASPRPLSSVSHVSREIANMVGSLLHRDPTRRQAAFESLKNEFDVRETSAVRAPAIGMGPRIEETLRVVLQKGSLRVILVEGPQGLGKSRFVAEIKQHVSLMDQPVTVCELKGQQVARGLAEGVVAIADEQKSAMKSTSLPRVREWLGNAAETQDLLPDEAGLRDLISLLAAVAQKTRLLLLIEDLDRSNKTSAKLLESIVQQPIDLDLAILVTTRPSGIPPKTLNVLSKYVGPNLHQTAIEPLSSADSEKLVSFFTRDQKRGALAQERAAGNPSFLEAYARQASASISPKSVRSALSGMILKLPDHARSVAEVLSVLGRSVEWSVLANITGMPETDLNEAVASLRRIGLTNGEQPTIQYPDARMLLENRLSRSRRMDLHATAYRCLRDQRSDNAILAEHAFHGGLYEDAADLYRQLARDSFEAKNRGRAATYYGKVLECCLKDPKVQPLDGWDSVKLAISHAYLGKETSARHMLNHLLRSEATHGDAELLSTVYSALASSLLEESIEERIALIKKAINCLPERSPLLVKRHRSLMSSFLAAGDVEGAEQVLTECERSGMPVEELQELGEVRASIFMNQGRFKSAVDCLISQEFKWAIPGFVSNNLAVCIDLLGDLKRAREFQMSAYRAAVGSRLFFGEVMSLSNLGSMEAKMGNIAEAEKHFSLALSKLRDRDQEAHTGLSFGITYADAAAHFLQRGDFRAARQCMQKIDLDQGSPFTLMESLSILHARYYVEVALGQRENALEMLEQARKLPLRAEFFEIEHLMAETRINTPTRELCDRLRDSVLIAQRLGTLYQECQVLLALARVLLSLDNIQEANRPARRARRLSAAHGYRLLEAEALLLIGLSSQGKIKKEFFLSRSLNESSRLGLAPLAAECAFKMGSWRLNIGEFATAAEYLAQSVSITTRLAEQLTGPNRKTYLDIADHRAARELLDTASRGVTIPVAKLPGVDNKEDSFFANLYRLGATMSASSSIESATSCLLEALKRSMDYPVTVIFGLGESTSFHSLRSHITEQKKQRILNTVMRSANKTYISGSGTEETKKTTVWVPLLSLTHPGGIYMECPGGQIAPEERHIEFLTLVGAIAGAVFDRIVAKGNGVAIPSSAVSHGIVGTSKRVGEIHEQIEIAATNDANVLIEGESGTGKELVARAIHAQSARAMAPFVPVDCGALPEALIEAELFGAKRGSYTGSLSDRVGLFEAAHRGTIFLDEISNLGLAAQAKLLRVLQDREVRKIGSTSGKFVDVRLIAATNCNVEKLAQQGKFRNDLLYRLKVLYFLIPPLRERKGDIPVLATSFLERLNTLNKAQKYFGPAVMPKLTASNYPGNVRELQNAVERAFYSTRGAVITQISSLGESSGSPALYDTENWFRDLTEGRQDFWRAVHDPYKRRDIPRERVVALVDYGLRTTRGNYKAMASKLQIPKDEYRRFMDFLRRSKCLLDFRPYRRMAEPSE